MRTVFKRLIFVLCACIIIPFPLISRSPKPFHFFHHDNWTMEDGLPMNSVFEIAQTPDGYIWLATESGLARFDGIKFEEINWQPPPADASPLVLRLLVDRLGALWIGTRGSGLVRYYNGHFRQFGVKNGLSGNEIWALAESMDGTVWIGTHNGLDFYRDGKISKIDLPKPLRHQSIRSLLVDSRGRLWIGSNGGGLGVAAKIGRRFEVEFKGLAGERINAIFEDKIGRTWIATKTSGLIRIHRKRFTYLNTDNSKLPVNNVRCLYEDPSGNLWIGTKGGGICIYNPNDNRFTKLDEYGEPVNSSIFTFFEDREKTLWFGTQGGGLNRLRNTPITTYTTRNGLSSNVLYGVFQDSRGCIWIGTKGFGANCFYPETNKIETITKKDGLSTNSITSFAETPTGTLWISTIGGGVNRLNLENRRIDVFKKKNGLTDNFIRALYVDPEGALWAGSDNGGLHRFENGRFKVIKKLKYRINVIHKDKQGTLWLGTFGGGLFRIKGETVEVFDKNRGMSGNYIATIYEDRDGALWIANTGYGITYFKDGKSRGISRRNGLPNNSVHAILTDNKNNIWMSSNRGIFYIDQQDIKQYITGKTSNLHFFQFGIEDGMRSLETNGGSKPAGLKDREGKLWFPSTKGICVVDPSNLQSNIPPPPVKIEKIRVKREAIKIDNHRGIILPPGNRNLEIHYTALSFIGSKKIRFRYKLEGWEDEWIETGTRRFAVYTNIPPGSYRFMVSACHRDGTWNRDGAALDIRLEARFYETLPFKIFFPIFALAAFYFSYTWIRKTRAARRLERKYKKSCTTPEESRQCLDKIIRHIESQKVYRSPEISLNSLSETLNINPRKISLVFNEHLHKNFYEVMNHYRVEEAKTLLRASTNGEKSDKSDKSILEICYEVGFNHKSSFNRVFKGVTGMTPSEYKKKGESNSRGRNLN